MLELAESTPVKVNLYVPAVVAGVLEPPEPEPEPPEPEFELPLPAHPTTPVTTMIKSSASSGIHRRLRAGTPIKNRPAKIVPPPKPNRFIREGAMNATVDAAFACTVSTVVPVPPVSIFTLAGLRLHVGRLCAAAGELTRAQLIFIVPE